MGDLISDAGWIPGGPGYRQWLSGDCFFVDTSAGISWRSYEMAQARVEASGFARSRVNVGARVRRQDLTQITCFGEGPTALGAAATYGAARVQRVAHFARQ